MNHISKPTSGSTSPVEVTVTDKFHVQSFGCLKIKLAFWIAVKAHAIVLWLIKPSIEPDDDPVSGMVFFSNIGNGKTACEHAMKDFVHPRGQPQYFNAPERFLRVTDYVLTIRLKIHAEPVSHFSESTQGINEAQTKGAQ